MNSTSSSVAAGYEGDEAIAELIRQLTAEGQSKEARRRAAAALVKNGSDAAVRSLQAVLVSGTPEIQGLIAEALGQCAHAESSLMLERLLKNASEPVVLAAIRSLSQQSTPLAVTSLSQLLYDGERTVDVRAEAAIGLGAMAQPEALAILASAVLEIQDEAVASSVIRGIAGRPVEETQAFLQTFLAAPQVSVDLKTEALEGLSQATGDATPLLLLYAKSTDPELRVAAAWALGTVETRGNAGADILALIGQETNPLVRRRLYQALANQESFDLNAAWTQVANEPNRAARIAGLDLIAGATKESPSSEMTAFFDQHALPEAKEAALNGSTKDERLSSVMVLRRAMTDNSILALREIAAQASDPNVVAATGLAPKGN